MSSIRFRGDAARQVARGFGIVIPRADFGCRIVDGAMLITDRDGPVSVTNDAEAVVHVSIHNLKQPTDRIFYRDTDGRWDELKHDGKKFVDFGTISDADRATFNLT